MANAIMSVEMTDERLAWHFENWSRYMRNDGSEYRKLGHPSRSSGMMNGISVSEDSSELQESEADRNDAKTMDAIIDSLKFMPMGMHYHCAIYHQWLSAVYKMRDFEEAYENACIIVKQLAAKRGLT